MKAAFALLLLALGATRAQFFHQPSLSYEIQPPPFQQQQQASFGVPVAQQRSLAHRAVVQNAEMEARLPSNLLNPFYKNPRIMDALAKQSWFADGEMQVVDREAEKIPRMKVYSILHNAGLARR